MSPILQDSFGGTTTSVYDAANHLTSHQFSASSQPSLREDFTYNGTDQPATATRYSDVAGTNKVGSTTYTYDADNRITAMQYFDGGGTSLASSSYSFDSAGNLQSQTINGTTTSYGYDTTNQLTADGGTAYSYDATGNRTNTGYSTTTGNELTSDGTWTYSYDAEGNVIKKTKGASAETWTYGYDNANHLLWAEQRATDGGTLLMRVDYAYDVFGNRIQKAVNQGGSTTTTEFVLDGWKDGGNAWGQTSSTVGNENWDVWGEIQVGSSGLNTRNFRGDAIDQLLGQIGADGTVDWLLTDRLGTVRDLTDGTGALRNTLGFTAFGVLVSATSSFNTRYLYAGREWDPETGLYYERARYYDPATGRFLSQDPAGLANDLNGYRYVHNMPDAATDPSGLEQRPVQIRPITSWTEPEDPQKWHEAEKLREKIAELRQAETEGRKGFEQMEAYKDSLVLTQGDLVRRALEKVGARDEVLLGKNGATALTLTPHEDFDPDNTWIDSQGNYVKLVQIGNQRVKVVYRYEGGTDLLAKDPRKRVIVDMTFPCSDVSLDQIKQMHEIQADTRKNSFENTLPWWGYWPIGRVAVGINQALHYYRRGDTDKGDRYLILATLGFVEDTALLFGAYSAGRAIASRLAISFRLGGYRLGGYRLAGELPPINAPISVGRVPSGGTVLETDSAGRWVVYKDGQGVNRIQFDARRAQNFREPSPRPPGMPGSRPTRATLAGIDTEGNVLVIEGRHRLQALQQGATITPDEGGVPGLPGWLDYVFYEQ